VLSANSAVRATSALHRRATRIPRIEVIIKLQTLPRSIYEHPAPESLGVKSMSGMNEKFSFLCNIATFYSLVMKYNAGSKRNITTPRSRLRPSVISIHSS
jgi:hypothetical protein